MLIRHYIMEHLNTVVPIAIFFFNPMISRALQRKDLCEIQRNVSIDTLSVVRRACFDNVEYLVASQLLFKLEQRENGATASITSRGGLLDWNRKAYRLDIGLYFAIGVSKFFAPRSGIEGHSGSRDTSMLLVCLVGTAQLCSFRVPPIHSVARHTERAWRSRPSAFEGSPQRGPVTGGRYRD